MNENEIQHLQAMQSLKSFLVEMDFNGNTVQDNISWFYFLKDKGIAEQTEKSSFTEKISEEERESIQSNLKKMEEDQLSEFETRFELILAVDTRLWVAGKFIKIEQGNKRFVRAIFQDVTEIILQERMVNYMAYHDNLTGLPNRMLFEEEIEKAVCSAQKNGTLFALAFIGLDNFKFINNSLGHKQGDRIIFAISKRLNSELPENAVLGRWTGDIFILLLKNLRDESSVRELGKKLISLNRLPVKALGGQFYVSCSIGFALYPEDTDSIEKLLALAESTLQKVKSLGRNHFMLVSDLPNKAGKSHDIQIRNLLSEAVKKVHLEPFFQPKIDAKSGQVTGMEALARWHDANLGWISPGDFIPIAENMGLMDEIGLIIIEKSLRVLEALTDYKLKLAINVSLQQLILADLVETFQKKLAEHRVDPSLLVIEITESMPILEMDIVLKQLNDLQNAGFQISIDDFGTGYSSFSRLHEIPVNELKLDIFFVRRIHTIDGFAILKAIVDVGRSLNLSIVAEGVEDENILNKLEALDIDSYQGYYFCKPLNSLEFINFVRQRNTF